VSWRDIVSHQLRIDEGVRNRPYKDTVGKLTIGVGRNLDDVGVNDDEIALMLDHDIDEAERTARRVLVGSFDDLTDERKAAVVNMAFNMGFDRLSGFKKCLRRSVRAATPRRPTRCCSPSGRSRWVSAPCAWPAR
jgi:lysozyme